VVVVADILPVQEVNTVIVGGNVDVDFAGYAFKYYVARRVLSDRIVSLVVVQVFGGTLANNDEVRIHLLEPFSRNPSTVSSVVGCEEYVSRIHRYFVFNLFHEVSFEVAHPQDCGTFVQAVLHYGGAVVWAEAFAGLLQRSLIVGIARNRPDERNAPTITSDWTIG